MRGLHQAQRRSCFCAATFRWPSWDRFSLGLVAAAFRWPSWDRFSLGLVAAAFRWPSRDRFSLGLVAAAFRWPSWGRFPLGLVAAAFRWPSRDRFSPGLVAAAFCLPAAGGRRAPFLASSLYWPAFRLVLPFSRPCSSGLPALRLFSSGGRSFGSDINASENRASAHFAAAVFWRKPLRNRLSNARSYTVRKLIYAQTLYQSSGSRVTNA